MLIIRKRYLLSHVNQSASTCKKTRYRVPCSTDITAKSEVGSSLHLEVKIGEDLWIMLLSAYRPNPLIKMESGVLKEY